MEPLYIVGGIIALVIICDTVKYCFRSSPEKNKNDKKRF